MSEPLDAPGHPRHPGHPGPPVPDVGRPHMPDYGISAGGEGLLRWSWAEERLAASAEMWVASVWPDGRPHVMPVWAVWTEGAVWFSTSPRSRKARNLLAEPRCTVTTDDTRRPLVIDGVAELVTDAAAVGRFTDAVNAKYDSDYGVEFFLANRTFRVVPVRAFGLEEDAFATSPTRWSFAGSDDGRAPS